jgi:DNA adenine methylase
MLNSHRQMEAAITLQLLTAPTRARKSLESRQITVTVPTVAPRTKPFLKWTGGKQWLASTLAALIAPTHGARYFEPFLGGGSVYFAILPQTAILSDRNLQLIRTFRAVQEHPEQVIRRLRRLRNSKTIHAAMRSYQPRSDVSSAVRLIYLNKTSFNGIYRENQQGRFNVPFGHYINPTICNENRIRDCSAALSRAVIMHEDFESSTAAARAGDWVYFDPPYITGHTNNGFLKYNADLFSWSDQCRLAACAMRLARNGVRVTVSHAPFSPVLELYKGFWKFTVARHSLVGGRSALRGRVIEAVLTSFDLTPTATGGV